MELLSMSTLSPSARNWEDKHNDYWTIISTSGITATSVIYATKKRSHERPAGRSDAIFTRQNQSLTYARFSWPQEGCHLSNRTSSTTRSSSLLNWRSSSPSFKRHFRQHRRSTSKTCTHSQPFRVNHSSSWPTGSTRSLFPSSLTRTDDVTRAGIDSTMSHPNAYSTYYAERDDARGREAVRKRSTTRGQG